MGKAIIERTGFFFSQENQFLSFFSKKKNERERRKQAICLLVLNPKGLAL